MPGDLHFIAIELEFLGDPYRLAVATAKNFCRFHVGPPYIRQDIQRRNNVKLIQKDAAVAMITGTTYQNRRKWGLQCDSYA